MPKSVTKERVTVEVSIRPRPASLAQKQTWRRFWGRLITKAKSEAAE